MWEPFFQGLWLVLQWPAFGFMLLGIVLGIWLGAVPGLGGILGLVILLPFTFGMEPVPAFALLLGMFAVTTTADTIASVLLGIPGTAASRPRYWMDIHWRKKVKQDEHLGQHTRCRLSAVSSAR